MQMRLRQFLSDCWERLKLPIGVLYAVVVVLIMLIQYRWHTIGFSTGQRRGKRIARDDR